MLQPFMEEEIARQRNQALSIAAQRAAESARYRKELREKSRLSRAVGVRFVRLGLRFTGGRAAVVLKGTRRSPEPMLVRR